MKSSRPVGNICIGILILFLAACATFAPPLDHQISQPSIVKKEIECKITIVGGGAAGVYLAYRLSAIYGSDLCLFEKESQLGGRMTDETLGAGSPASGIWVGTGARRVDRTQAQVLALGKELGLSFQTPPKRTQLIHSQARYAFTPDAFVDLFPGLIGPLDQDPNTTREDEIYALLIREKAKASQYPDLKTYIRAIAGDHAREYLRASGRFHADFDLPISAPNYLDTLEQELKLAAESRYPVGGMSAFIRAMQIRIETRKGRIFLAEPALEFFEIPKTQAFRVITSRYAVTARRLVFAVPPSGFDHIGGVLADQIREAPEYRALLPVPIVVINQWWKDAWWSKLSPAPGHSGREGLVWRAWSTDQCVNHTEIPQEPYAAAGKVTRSVYTDDPQCVQWWQQVLKNGGTDAVEKEVLKGLEQLFGYGKAIHLTPPIRTSFHFWPAGWYYVRAGSKRSNAQIAQWSIEPLPGRKNLMLVGESYWPDRPGWSEGAYLSADALMRASFAQP